MRIGYVRWVAAALLGLAAAGPAAAASSAAGGVEGIVRDALQRPVADATVRLQDATGHTLATVRSGPDGRFELSHVAPGVYALIGDKKGFVTASAVVTVGPAGASAALTLASEAPLELALTSRKLSQARSRIEPRIGATTYTLSGQAIASQPGGANLPLDQTLLQAPGVSQDSFGQIHLRNDHANIQYRIDGVILPEGISFFGQSLTSRFASSIDLITGSLPAEYRLVTTGIVDIQTKSGALQQGGSIGLYGGSHGWVQPSVEYDGSSGSLSYYVARDYLQNSIGIENPTGSKKPIHDFTRQQHGFAYLEKLIDPSSKVSLIAGTYQGNFQIPNNPAQVPTFQYGSRTSLDSSLLDETQQESNSYAALSYLKSTQQVDYQVSAFARSSSLAYTPDTVGDLMFYGIAQNASREDSRRASRSTSPTASAAAIRCATGDWSPRSAPPRTRARSSFRA